ncbi:MAG: bi-domain-containing oxidoreductase [Anaerolineae bacterium]|nr:bi-domain-containing oxidoreductase [Anaerolineae bacterium]
MKQVLQSLKTGETQVVEVPTPRVQPGHLLIATQRTLISAGTERTLVEFGNANLVQKALSQPERMQQVLDKVRTDGLSTTMEAVFAKLDEPLALGYCNAGVVIEVGAGVRDFAVGDRVVSNGPHAEIVSAPTNLCARIPSSVDDETAAFTVISAIGLQGVRLTAPTLGESVVVMGLGLIGLLTVQILVANGCRVLGIDFDVRKLELARKYGAEVVDLSQGADPVTHGLTFSNSRGVDAVIITASSKSNDLVHQAAQMSRKRGRIVLVGVVGLQLLRADFYEKELSFQVSCSYGPGRYDESYELTGHDYPFGFVRWTEQRNFEAVLDLMKAGRIDVTDMISTRVAQADAATAYKLLTEDKNILGILLSYPEQIGPVRRTVPVHITASSAAGSVTIGMVGSGNFASRTLLPALVKTPAILKSVVSSKGVSARQVAQRFNIAEAGTDSQALINDTSINTVFVVTRHDTHAKMVIEALNKGKHVFVEKPLALSREELAQIEQTLAEHPGQQLLVGFNRRFAPFAVRLKELIAGRSQPCSLIYTVNAGDIPAKHWTQDPQVGGGRIIGEACHFIDLLLFLVGSRIINVDACMMGRVPGVEVRTDKMSIQIDFENGSTGVVHYFANGSKAYPKERLEVFSEGRIAVLDNYRSLRGYGWKGLKNSRSRNQDKGHEAEMKAFVERIQSGGELLIPWPDLRDVTLASFVAVERAAEARSSLIDDRFFKGT